MHTTEWWQTKARSVLAALPEAFASKVALLLAVACHETNCGDAWPGEHNWGATTRGPLSTADRAALATAHVLPILGPTSARLASEAAANIALGPRSDRTIHVDSRPAPASMSAASPHAARMGFHKLLLVGQVAYFTWFAKFDDDDAGAAYFIGFFKTTAELAALESGNPSAIARAMYQAHYYTGFSPDAETDIADYTRAIAPLFTEALAALAGPTVNWRLVQSELNNAGVDHPLKVDGIPGPETIAALRAFQEANDLPTTGEADDATLQALRGPEANA